MSKLEKARKILHAAHCWATTGIDEVEEILAIGLKRVISVRRLSKQFYIPSDSDAELKRLGKLFNEFGSVTHPDKNINKCSYILNRRRPYNWVDHIREHDPDNIKLLHRIALYARDCDLDVKKRRQLMRVMKNCFIILSIYLQADNDGRFNALERLAYFVCDELK